MHRRIALAPSLALGLFTSCLSLGETLPLRHFEPPSIAPLSASGALPAASTPRQELRLGRVTASPWLDERMVWRLSDVETTFDEQNRWSSSPANFVQQGLEQMLFEGDAFVSAMSIDAPELLVRVERFEGRLDASVAALALVATLRPNDGSAPRTARFASEAPLDSGTPEALARGLGRALGDALPALRAWVAEGP